jgi:hypothetical protein
MSVSLSESTSRGAAVRAVGSNEFDIEARHGKYLSTRGANFLPAPHAPCAKPFTASIECLRIESAIGWSCWPTTDVPAGIASIR